MNDGQNLGRVTQAARAVARLIDFVSPGTRREIAQLGTQLGIPAAYYSWEYRVRAYYAGIGANLDEIRTIIALLNLIDRRGDVRHITNVALVEVGEQEDIVKQLLDMYCTMVVFSSEQMRANRATSEAALATAHGAFRRAFIDALLRPVIQTISRICITVESNAAALDCLDHLPREYSPGIWEQIEHVRRTRDQLRDLLAEILTPDAISRAILTWDGVNQPMPDIRGKVWTLFGSANKSVGLILAAIATVSHPTVTLETILAQVARICTIEDARNASADE